MRPLLLSAVLLGAPALAGAAAPAHPPSLVKQGEVLALYRDARSAPLALAKSRLGLSVRQRLMRGRLELLQLPAYLPLEGALAELRDDPAVALAEPNLRRFRRTVIPTDPLFGDQWGLQNTGQDNFVPGGPAGIAGGDLNLVEAWDGNEDGSADRTGDPAVIVAVIDDAVDTQHPDLAPVLWVNPGEIAGDGLDNDGNGFVDDVNGWNFPGGNGNPRPAGFDETHGTSVAACAVARGNDGAGIAGVAWNARLMSLKFDLDTAQHIAALEYAAAMGAKIINASFGGPVFSDLERLALAELAASDILYVAAGGNDDSNTDVAVLNYPANYDLDHIVSVAATNRQDDIASFSQYGPLTSDVAAPGLQIVTALPLFVSQGNPYTTGGISGTSFAAPYVAGVAALIRSHVPGVTWRDLKARLIESGSAVPGANPRRRTIGGRVDADRALDLADGPSLVIASVAIDDPDGNGRLDPGEALALDVAVRNIWKDATGVTATLSSASPRVTVDATPAALGDLAADQGAVASYGVTVQAGLEHHYYVPFTLDLAADGGYAATRDFILEIGRLQPDTPVTQAFLGRDRDLYDEFHAWHFDLAALPEGHNQLVFETTSSAPGHSSPDVDLLVKRGEPPRYNITVGINPEDAGQFCTSGVEADACRDPLTLLSARPDGNERVAVTNPVPGTYHVVVVNFAQLDGGLSYTLRAYTRAAPRRGGGGKLPPALLAALLAAALLRRSRGR